jgi:hypothetical protein
MRSFKRLGFTLYSASYGVIFTFKARKGARFLCYIVSLKASSHNSLEIVILANVLVVRIPKMSKI